MDRVLINKLERPMKPNYERTSILQFKRYISWVDECPCGNSTIKLYKGSESDEHHTISNKLEIFLKGSNKQKELLQKESPDLVSHFKMIWDIRTRHMIQGLPSSYIFSWDVIINLSVIIPFASLVNQLPLFVGTLVAIQFLISLYLFQILLGHGAAKPVLIARIFVQATILFSLLTLMTLLHWNALQCHHLLLWSRNSHNSWPKEFVKPQMNLSKTLLNLSFWVLKKQRFG